MTWNRRQRGQPLIGKLWPRRKNSWFVFKQSFNTVAGPRFGLSTFSYRADQEKVDRIKKFHQHQWPTKIVSTYIWFSLRDFQENQGKAVIQLLRLFSPLWVLEAARSPKSHLLVSNQTLPRHLETYAGFWLSGNNKKVKLINIFWLGQS